MELIDLREHTGEHPAHGSDRRRAFVPVAGVTMARCVELARACGQRFGDELGIPVFLYEAAATRPERKNLATVREGQFEGLREKIGTDPARAPRLRAAAHPPDRRLHGRRRAQIPDCLQRESRSNDVKTGQADRQVDP